MNALNVCDAVINELHRSQVMEPAYVNLMTLTVCDAQLSDIDGGDNITCRPNSKMMSSEELRIGLKTYSE